MWVSSTVEGLLKAVAALTLKRPAEPHLVYLLQSARDRIAVGAVEEVWWLDTVDMTSDALTKSGISQEAIVTVWRTAEWRPTGDQPLSHRLRRVPRPESTTRKRKVASGRVAQQQAFQDWKRGPATGLPER